MTTLVDTPYRERMAALGYGPGDVVDTGACEGCGVAMVRRMNARADDSHWHAVGPEREPVDPWQRLDDLLEAGDVAAYSAAKAHRGLLGSWPWDHHHRPVPANR